MIYMMLLKVKKKWVNLYQEDELKNIVYNRLDKIKEHLFDINFNGEYLIKMFEELL